MARKFSELKKLQKKERRRINTGTRSFDQNLSSKSSTSVLAPTNLLLSNEQEKDKDLEISGLTNTCFCISPETLSSVLSSIVGDILTYFSNEKQDLVKHFSVYFSVLGWKTEHYMNVSSGTFLQMPDDYTPDENDVGMISSAIKLTLQCIAQFTARVRRRQLYLVKSTTFNEMLDYHASNCISHQPIYDATALKQGKNSSGADQKVTAFSVPKFIGNILEGQAFVENVVRKFKGYGQLSYLENNKYCDDHPVWS